MKEVIPLTVIIPVHNRQKKLERALDSIESQDVAPKEVIIVDDGSDNPVKISRFHSMPLKLIRHSQNRGAAAARNSGIRAASAEWISFLDSDDAFDTSSSLSKRWHLLTGQLDAVSGLTFFACGWCEKDSDGNYIRARIPRKAEKLEHFASGIWFAPGSCLIFNRKLLDRFGVLQDENLRRLEDYDWFLSLALCGAQMRVLPVCGVEIERGHNCTPELILASVSYIKRKWLTRDLQKNIRDRIFAYLELECAAANYAHGRYFTAVKFLARSFVHLPRGKLHFSPGWDTIGGRSCK